ncbi:MAG: glutamine--tRNA ligase/YqeY domain fusion protein [Deltaproteobacteria bacterium]|jgi:glutaminyl-tRNA synthetase|nr:glutamine--tRNA ligase/YqeY domain fusion protein [Deltaproteobacteria bacterium]
MSEIDTSNLDFIRTIVAQDLAAGKNDGRLVTRFPPEPNGYLHIGHAKSICLNFGLAQEYPQGVCHMRFDDTNPEKESVEYTEAIQADVKWLGFDWGENLFYASDYFEALYDYAVQLVTMGKAYVCSLTAEEMRAYRGTLKEPGKNSPHRMRSVTENLALLEGMKNGAFSDGAHVLRAKIDMASPNINMRDPIIYRIRKVSHHRTGDQWCIYPMYDFTHSLSDAMEKITHSLCTLEFADHRPLYDWFLDTLQPPCHPQQIEFARLNLNFTVMSKRKLMQMVDEKLVNGWDDPRMLTISGLRRRGYTPASIRKFCAEIGVAKRESRIDMGILENAVRDDLNDIAPRRLAVLHPLKVVITNYPEEKEEELTVANHPKNPEMGTRLIPFSREIYIDHDDFLEEPPKKFFRLAPGREVRLRAAYFITCNEVVKDAAGAVIELRCSYDPASRGGSSPDGRKVKATLHWVSARHAVAAEIRHYDRLFNQANPEADPDIDFKEHLNPDSLQILADCMVEPSLLGATSRDYFQFERVGFFHLDSKESRAARPVFNRTVTLRDTWAKVAAQ